MPVEENREGEDLATPLPWTAKGELAGVVLYGELLSPPSAKIRALLCFYGVPFAVGPQHKPGSTYRKRPILDIGVGAAARQVNDSAIIFKNVAPILCGAPLDERTRRMDAHFTNDFMLALEAEAFGEGTEAELGRFILQDFWITSPCVWWVVSKLAGMRILRGIAKGVRRKHPALRPATAYLSEFKAGFADGAAFWHGDAPGPLDIATFGLVFAFVEPDVRVVRDAIAAAGLVQWYAAVRAAFAPADLRRMFPA